jgi:DNA-binding XRE family transcriptional regulator
MNPEEYKSIREKLALTQGKLAARLGVTRKTINARETGAARITTEAALAIRALKRR